MNWLLQQQKILLVIVRLGIEIGVAEASKGGSHTEGEDTTSIDVPEEDLEDHTIFVSPISGVHDPVSVRILGDAD